jgi:hypothetical protein
MDPVSDDQAESDRPSDTPAADLIWGGLLAWMRGTLAVIGVALAIHATLGWPRPSAAMLTGGQVLFLVIQALASSAVIVQSGQRLLRHLPWAVAVAFVAGVPASLAVLMIGEWSGGREAPATWGHLFKASVQLAVVETVPIGYLLWRFSSGFSSAFSRTSAARTDRR